MRLRLPAEEVPHQAYPAHRLPSCGSDPAFLPQEVLQPQRALQAQHLWGNARCRQSMTGTYKGIQTQGEVRCHPCLPCRRTGEDDIPSHRMKGMMRSTCRISCIFSDRLRSYGGFVFFLYRISLSTITPFFAFVMFLRSKMPSRIMRGKAQMGFETASARFANTKFSNAPPQTPRASARSSVK